VSAPHPTRPHPEVRAQRASKDARYRLVQHHAAVTRHTGASFEARLRRAPQDEGQWRDAGYLSHPTHPHPEVRAQRASKDARYRLVQHHAAVTRHTGPSFEARLRRAPQDEGQWRDAGYLSHPTRPHPEVRARRASKDGRYRLDQHRAAVTRHTGPSFEARLRRAPQDEGPWLDAGYLSHPTQPHPEVRAQRASKDGRCRLVQHRAAVTRHTGASFEARLRRAPQDEEPGMKEIAP
jgi:hypothetical protein